jgi:DNA-binding MarR family transcriptional regulator
VEPADFRSYQVVEALRRISLRVSRYSRALARETGLTLPQQMCLRAVRASDVGLTIAQLSAAVSLSASTVSGIVDRLQRDGWVCRERSTVDRRRVVVQLTERGRARLETLPPPLPGEAVARLNQQSPEEVAELLSVLAEVAEWLGEVPAEE